MVEEVDKLLTDRGQEYGDYNTMCSVIQKIKYAMKSGPNWVKLSDAQREALEMCATKIGRILTGNRNNRDSWMDIAGYIIKVVEVLPQPEEVVVSKEDLVGSSILGPDRRGIESRVALRRTNTTRRKQDRREHAHTY